MDESFRMGHKKELLMERYWSSSKSNRCNVWLHEDSNGMLECQKLR